MRHHLHLHMRHHLHQVWTSRDGRAFSVWRGLPYAKPPVGARRFRRPEALDSEDSWRGERTFQAEMPRWGTSPTNTGQVLPALPGGRLPHGPGGLPLPQVSRLSCSTSLASVYTPVTSDNTLLPVMVR